MERLVTFFSEKLARPAGQTAPLDPAQLDQLEAAPVQPPAPAVFESELKNPAFFPPGSSLLLRIAGYGMLVDKVYGDLVLGRLSDRKDEPSPARRINLVRFAGYRSGLSRIHAMLRPVNDRLAVIDMDSLNGTLLNGRELEPFRNYFLTDGDLLQLALVPIRVYFLYA